MDINSYTVRGFELRSSAKQLVLDFMQASPECMPYAEGMRQAEIFHACGFDWGAYPNATSSSQQYWIVALLRELEKESKVQKDEATKLWRLK